MENIFLSNHQRVGILGNGNHYTPQQLFEPTGHAGYQPPRGDVPGPQIGTIPRDLRTPSPIVPMPLMSLPAAYQSGLPDSGLQQVSPRQPERVPVPSPAHGVGNTLIIDGTNINDPLCMAYRFTLQFRDFRFNSMLQAYYCTLAKMLNLDELANQLYNTDSNVLPNVFDQVNPALFRLMTPEFLAQRELLLAQLLAVKMQQCWLFQNALNAALPSRIFVLSMDAHLGCGTNDLVDFFPGENLYGIALFKFWNDLNSTPLGQRNEYLSVLSEDDKERDRWGGYLGPLGSISPPRRRSKDFARDGSRKRHDHNHFQWSRHDRSRKSRSPEKRFNSSRDKDKSEIDEHLRRRERDSRGRDRRSRRRERSRSPPNPHVRHSRHRSRRETSRDRRNRSDRSRSRSKQSRSGKRRRRSNTKRTSSITVDRDHNDDTDHRLAPSPPVDQKCLSIKPLPIEITANGVPGKRASITPPDPTPPTPLMDETGAAVSPVFPSTEAESQGSQPKISHDVVSLDDAALTGETCQEVPSPIGNVPPTISILEQLDSLGTVELTNSTQPNPPDAGTVSTDSDYPPATACYAMHVHASIPSCPDADRDFRLPEACSGLGNSSKDFTASPKPVPEANLDLLEPETCLLLENNSKDIAASPKPGHLTEDNKSTNDSHITNNSWQGPGNHDRESPSSVGGEPHPNVATSSRPIPYPWESQVPIGASASCDVGTSTDPSYSDTYLGYGVSPPLRFPGDLKCLLADAFRLALKMREENRKCEETA